MKFNDTLMTLVRKNLNVGLIPMLIGEPGIGKSSWVIELGKLMHTKVFVLPCNQLADKADLTGARLVPITNPKTGEITDYEQMFYPHSVINRAIAYAIDNPRETPILFMDELNRTTPDVTSEALSIPTLRSIGNKELPNNLRVITAGNDKGNITSLDEASISRFVLYHVGPDVDTFLSLDDTMNPFVRDVLEHHPECIFCKEAYVTTDSEDEDADVNLDDILDDGEVMSQIATPRTIMGVSRWLNEFTNDELKMLLADVSTINGEEVSVLREAIEGHTGKTNFTTYLIASIATGIMSTNSQANKLIVPKPNAYDNMKACDSMTTLNTFVATMQPHEVSGCMVYALYEKTDNTNYINALSPSLVKFESGDMQTLMRLALDDLLDDGNKSAFLNTRTPLSTTLEAMIG